MTDFTIVAAARKNLAANPQLSAGPAAQLHRFLALENVLIGFSEGVDGPRLEAGLTWAKHGGWPSGALISLFAAPHLAAMDEGEWEGDPINAAREDLIRLDQEAKKAEVQARLQAPRLRRAAALSRTRIYQLAWRLRAAAILCGAPFPWDWSAAWTYSADLFTYVETAVDEGEIAEGDWGEVGDLPSPRDVIDVDRDHWED